MSNHKDRIKSAVEKYLTKNDPALQKPKRTNNSPERDLQKEAIKWLNSSGFSVNSIESKAQFSEATGRYTAQTNIDGLPDIIGNDTAGRAIYIEMKAPGRKNTLRDNQRKFLIQKINTNCFAIVADSIEYIKKTYAAYCDMPFIPMGNRMEFLLSELPKEKASKDEGELFPNE